MKILLRNTLVGIAVGLGLSVAGLSMLTLNGFIVGTVLIICILGVLELNK